MNVHGSKQAALLPSASKNFSGCSDKRVSKQTKLRRVPEMFVLLFKDAPISNSVLKDK